MTTGDIVLDDIDDVRIVDQGVVRARLGLMATFFVEHPERRSTRQALVECGLEYLREHGDSIRWAFQPGEPWLHTMDRVTLDAKHRVLERSDLEALEALDFIYHGGERRDDASLFTCQALAVQPRKATRLGFLMLALPIGWARISAPGAFTALVMRMCTRLQPLHGYAGFGLITSADYGAARRASPFIYPFAKRFPGLEIDAPISHLRFMDRGIKGVNWITVLSEQYVAQLGGRDMLRGQLTAENPVYDFPGGVIIQAGPHPQIGDVNRRDEMRAYRAVARILRPVRADYTDSFLSPPEGDRIQATRAWLERFD